MGMTTAIDLDQHDVALLSAERAELATPENRARTERLYSVLDSFGLRWMPVTGRYDGVDESSVAVFLPKSDRIPSYRNVIEAVLQCVGIQFQQESILVTRDGEAELQFLAEGYDEKIGRLVRVSADEAEAAEAATVVDTIRGDVVESLYYVVK